MDCELRKKYSLYSRNSVGRKTLEKFISKVYKKFYNADISFFHQNLLTVNSDRIEGVIGFSPCDQEMFLEQYLNSPLENEIYKLAMIKPKRESIVEVGNLAAVKNGCGARLIVAMTECLLLYGYKYAAFTGTSQVFSIFNKLSYTPMVISQASCSKVCDCDSWGSYYNYSPKVAVADLQILRERLLKNDFLNNSVYMKETRESLVKELLEA